MSELADVVGGNTITASFTNEVKERSVMRYADAAARDASIPAPIIGSLAFLSDVDRITVYVSDAGGAQSQPGWVEVALEGLVILGGDGTVALPAFSYVTDPSVGTFLTDGGSLGMSGQVNVLDGFVGDMFFTQTFDDVVMTVWGEQLVMLRISTTQTEGNTIGTIPGAYVPNSDVVFTGAVFTDVGNFVDAGHGAFRVRNSGAVQFYGAQNYTANDNTCRGSAFYVVGGGP